MRTKEEILKDFESLGVDLKMDKIRIKLNRVLEECLAENGFVRIDDYLIVKDNDGGYWLSKIVKEPFEILFTDEVENND